MTAEHIQVLGSVISVDIASPEDADRVRNQWSRCMAPSGATAVTSVAYGAQGDADRRDYALASALTLAGITQAAGSRLMLHAAGVAEPDSGRVAVLVAASGTGKTTAAHRLCASGFGYVSDETVSIGTDDDVLPYPKPLSVVIDGDSPHHKSQHGPDELGLTDCPSDPRAALFVLLDRDPEPVGPPEPVLEQLPLLDGLVALIPQTSALPAMHRPLQTLTGALRRAGGVWRLRYREIDDAADLLRDALDTPRADPSVVTEHAPADDGSGRPQPGGDDTDLPEHPHDRHLPDTARVIRTPYLDAVGIDDEILVLVDNRPVRLSGLGATIWAHSAAAISDSELIELCVAEHGDHPRAADLVRDAIGELVQHQALQRTR